MSSIESIELKVKIPFLFFKIFRKCSQCCYHFSINLTISKYKMALFESYHHEWLKRASTLSCVIKHKYYYMYHTCACNTPGVNISSTVVSAFDFIIGFKHVFSCINIHRVLNEMLKLRANHEGINLSKGT